MAENASKHVGGAAAPRPRVLHRPLWHVLRRTLGRMLLLVISLSAALALAEGVVRLIAPQQPSWLDVFRRHPVLPYALQPNVERHIDTGESAWSVYTDADGFRCSGKKVTTPPEAQVVLVLGDSFTFGLGVDYEETFAGVLQSSLGSAFRVVNAGVEGYGPRQYNASLAYLLGNGLSPRYVIVATFLGNDFHDCVWGKDLPVIDGVLGNETTLRGFVKRNSHLYRLVSRGYHILGRGATSKELSPTAPDLYSENRWQEAPLHRCIPIYRDEFRAMFQTCKARKIGFLVCIIPEKEGRDGCRAWLCVRRARTAVRPCRGEGCQRLRGTGHPVLRCDECLGLNQREEGLFHV